MMRSPPSLPEAMNTLSRPPPEPLAKTKGPGLRVGLHSVRFAKYCRSLRPTH